MPYHLTKFNKKYIQSEIEQIFKKILKKDWTIENSKMIRHFLKRFIEESYYELEDDNLYCHSLKNYLMASRYVIEDEISNTTTVNSLNLKIAFDKAVNILLEEFFSLTMQEDTF